MVRTGLYKNGDILRVEDTPDAIVNNFEEAIRLIFQLESILNWNYNVNILIYMEFISNYNHSSKLKLSKSL